VFRAGDYEPEDLLDSIFENIRRKEKKIHAYIHLVDEKTLRDVARISLRQIKNGSARALTGMFLAVKDNTDVVGLPCTGGSKILQDNVSEKDAGFISKMREEGAAFVGKTNLDELAAFGIATNNPHFGRTFNPWDLTRIPGGSSGGSAAAVAAGEACASTGSDTGGSVRIPASFCNLTGFKPTYGRVSRSGVISMCWSLDHVGFMTRTVRDAALLLEVSQGIDDRDSSTLGSPHQEKYVFTDELNLRDLKIGIFVNPIRDSDEEVTARFRESVDVFSEMGAKVVDLSLPDVELVTPIIFAIALPEVASYHEDWLRTKKEMYGKVLRGYVQLGHTVLATQYLKAQRARTVIVRKMAKKFSEVDALLVPTNPSVAPKIDQDTIRIGGKEFPAFQVLTENTYPFNLLGLPALSIPAGFSDGMPVGMQIIGSEWREDIVLKVGDAFQRRTDHHLRKPAYSG